MVFEPTHLDGELLDHVYISNAFCANKATTAVIKNIYFSDHDVVKLKSHGILILEKALIFE